MSVLVNQLRDVAGKHAVAVRASSLSPLNHLRSFVVGLSPHRSAIPTPESDLQDVWKRLEVWIESSKPPRHLPLDVWKQVPFVLWWIHCGQPAIANQRVKDGLLWASSISLNRDEWIRTVAPCYLEAFNVPVACLAWLGNTLRHWCSIEPPSSVAMMWKVRDCDLRLWSPHEFPSTVQKKLWLNPKHEVSELLKEAGFDSARMNASDLSRRSFLSYLSEPIALAQGYEPWHFDRVKTWKSLVLPDAAEWPSDLASAVINGLLEPWVSSNPSEVNFQNAIHSTLEQWFGRQTDKWTGHWQHASPLSREILARWKVLDVMEKFFQRVEDYAKRRERHAGDETMLRQWQYRRLFWLAYYKRAVVTRARGLIGRGMMDEYHESKLRASFGKAMARFESTANKHQCGLLLEINGMLLVDLSHNGMAYFFLQDSKHRPSPDAIKFSRDHLDATADRSIAHHGSETYAWQEKFADFIHHHTGVRVHRHEFRLPS